MFTTRPLVFGQCQLDLDLERSHEVELLPAGADDPQTILGSGSTLGSSDSQYSLPSRCQKLMIRRE
jgi:hypothetical protein